MPRKKIIGHVAFIMDGNGRWATNRNLPRKEGHKEGIKSCIRLIKNIDKVDFNVKELSFYVFSEENWKRPISEIKNLFSLIEEYYKKFSDVAHEKNLKVRHYGSRRKLNRKLLSIIDDVTLKTRNNNGSCINLFFNYGSRNEIIEAINKLDSKKNISPNLFSRKLITAPSKDPDLIIRTGGEMRLSNFMLWQSAYSELYFTQKLWPDFNITDLKKTLINFKNRNRRYGSIND